MNRNRAREPGRRQKSTASGKASRPKEKFDFAAAAALRHEGRPRKNGWVRIRPLMGEFGCGKTHVYELIDQGVLPPSYAIGKRARAWDREELDIAHERIRAGLAFDEQTEQAIDAQELASRATSPANQGVNPPSERRRNQGEA